MPASLKARIVTAQESLYGVSGALSDPLMTTILVACPAPASRRNIDAPGSTSGPQNAGIATYCRSSGAGREPHPFAATMQSAAIPATTAGTTAPGFTPSTLGPDRPWPGENPRTAAGVCRVPPRL